MQGWYEETGQEYCPCVLVSCYAPVMLVVQVEEAILVGREDISWLGQGVGAVY